MSIPIDSISNDVIESSDALARPSRLVDFYELTKPRMNFLVVITTMVGFYMASSAVNRISVLAAIITLERNAQQQSGIECLPQATDQGANALTIGAEVPELLANGPGCALERHRNLA